MMFKYGLKKIIYRVGAKIPRNISNTNSTFNMIPGGTRSWISKCPSCCTVVLFRYAARVGIGQKIQYIKQACQGS